MYDPHFCGHVCWFVPPCRKAKFCGVPSQAVIKAGCAVGKQDKFLNTACCTLERLNICITGRSLHTSHM
jgi:hypothetical protein